MIAIRLTRVGKKNSPAYRVVVADKKRAVKRKFIEILGHYNPASQPKTLVIDKDRALFWISKGAQPSDTVNNLMCNLGILDKKAKVNKVYGKKLTKKAAKEGGNNPAPEASTEETAPVAQEEQAPEEPADNEATGVSEETPKETEQADK